MILFFDSNFFSHNIGHLNLPNECAGCKKKTQINKGRLKKYPDRLI